MVYESQIQFTLDTICPWTYLAKRRLERALSLVKADAPAKFTVTYMPYQLYPEATQEGEDKYQWYKKSKYGDSQLKMDTYKKVMTAYGDTEGIKYKFGGTVANTLQAHRVVQHFQETKGPETADKIINSLYTQYFEEERHPSSHETLLRATKEAGIDESEAKAFIDDEDEGLLDIKMAIREQKGNGVDAVPYITFVGRKRDISLEGCREVKEYVDAIEKIIKESM